MDREDPHRPSDNLDPSPSPGSNQEVSAETPFPREGEDGVPMSTSLEAVMMAPPPSPHPSEAAVEQHNENDDDDDDDDDTPEPEGIREDSERRTVSRDENLDDMVMVYLLNQRQIAREALYCRWRQWIRRLCHL